VPRLWSWVQFKVRGWGLTKVIEMMARKRMSRVMKLKLEYSLTMVTDQLLKAILDHPSISDIDLSGTDLTSVHPKLLSTVVAQLQQVSLAGSLLTLEQSDSLFSTLAKPDNFILRRLDISGLDLTLVNPDSLALALTKLEQVSLAESWLCPDQLKAFFRALASTPQTPPTSSSSSSWSTRGRTTSSSSWSPSQTKLTVLNLQGVPLSFLDPASFACAISQLEEVDITATRLTRMQKRQICRILLNPSKVKKLWIDGWSYSSNNQNVTKKNDNAENNVNDNEPNNNTIHDGNNNANINININANQYEGQLGGRQNHILTVGVA